MIYDSVISDSVIYVFFFLNLLCAFFLAKFYDFMIYDSVISDLMTLWLCDLWFMIYVFL